MMHQTVLVPSKVKPGNKNGKKVFSKFEVTNCGNNAKKNNTTLGFNMLVITP